MSQEVMLTGGDLNLVVRVGDTVRRPQGPWSPAVHALLRHFEAVGFDGAPRFLGIDEQGREILSFVEGEPGYAPVPASDEVVAELGRLLRRMHDAQQGFLTPPESSWQVKPGDTGTGDVVCHTDLFWTNVIFRDGRPAALIDWDLAVPGSRLIDIGSAASYFAPLRVDGQAIAWGMPIDRRGERLRALCDAYGLDAEGRTRLLDFHLAGRRLGYEAHRVWGGVERKAGWREMWDAGSGERMLTNMRWIEENREDLERWLR